MRQLPYPIFVLFFFFLFIAACIAITVRYLLTLRRALLLCAPRNRTAEPDTVWFLLIPFFNLVWPFILYPRISVSLEREFQQRGLPIEPNPAKSLGLTLAVLQACCIVPVLNLFTGIASLVCFIFYWNKISHCADRLAANSAAGVSVPGSSILSPGAPAPWNPPVTTMDPSASWQSQTQSQSQPPLQLPGRFCTNCGSPLNSGERFCSHCGSPVS